jgi:hypothetical protein
MAAAELAPRSTSRKARDYVDEKLQNIRKLSRQDRKIALIAFLLESTNMNTEEELIHEFDLTGEDVTDCRTTVQRLVNGGSALRKSFHQQKHSMIRRLMAMAAVVALAIGTACSLEMRHAPTLLAMTKDSMVH